MTAPMALPATAIAILLDAMVNLDTIASKVTCPTNSGVPHIIRRVNGNRQCLSVQSECPSQGKADAISRMQ
ncbi:hypothetical protein HNR23_003498 [Nocardiopsis mwathae]|uniref:Uncharacterized protein n=1 Tax=Nocardiopsis mwathae TaxID=1472723 RepID=A0A7W9YJR2_9ACTN|nr:hypothetical protein [Nocardiopsis mwathae]MBB6173438.1 hypothetical protein [Nocardiopsis mwathae]